MTDPREQFLAECQAEIARQGDDKRLQAASQEWLEASHRNKYSYHFTWLGRPIIQMPQDMLALQTIVHAVQPDLIIETGIAHGGGLIFYASLLELNAVCGGPPDARVLGIDVDIRPHNRRAIEDHPLFRRITMLEASSTAPETVAAVRRAAAAGQRVLVCLDSCHTHAHVLAELEAYAPLVTENSYCVVFDTVVESMPEAYVQHRPWGKGDNPLTAVTEFLAGHPEFVADRDLDNILILSFARGGYLKRLAVAGNGPTSQAGKP
ncbi:MAG: cephalosporin hydroxylase family protein [Planctomycetes bacterium]|nr:cephalosporin hydroxylase family protein [Planctomycetota bacterium]